MASRLVAFDPVVAVVVVVVAMGRLSVTMSDDNGGGEDDDNDNDDESSNDRHQRRVVLSPTQPVENSSDVVQWPVAGIRPLRWEDICWIANLAEFWGESGLCDLVIAEQPTEIIDTKKKSEFFSSPVFNVFLLVVPMSLRVASEPVVADLSLSLSLSNERRNVRSITGKLLCDAPPR